MQKSRSSQGRGDTTAKRASTAATRYHGLRDMTEPKETVLFLCIHNSARSQMAAAYLRRIGGGRFAVESAGLEPGRLNPLAIAAMQNDGIDIC